MPASHAVPTAHDWIRTLLLASLCWLSASAARADTYGSTTQPTAGLPSAGKPGGAVSLRVGEVWLLNGTVTASNFDGSHSRPLHRGDAVYVGDRVSAQADGEAVITTTDAGLIAVRPGASFITDRYQAEARKTDHIGLRLLKGSLRLISGWIGKLNHDEYRVTTPVATIGIRGTDHEPFILPEEATADGRYEAGSYDKVNRGATVLITDAGEVEVPAGRAGFVADAGGEAAPGEVTRGMMTLLLPVLLDQVPDFYVGGSFENEIDDYSKHADAIIQKNLDQAQSAGKGATSCDPQTIGKDWIARFDAAVAARDADQVMALFADDAHIEANTTSRSGKVTTTRFNRVQFARSAQAAVKGLENYQQRRETLKTEPRDEAGATCSAIGVRSYVIESGVLNGKPYRVESEEDYTLAPTDGVWRARQAVVTQK